MPFVELDQIRAGALEVTNQGIFMTDQAQLVVLFATRTYVWLIFILAHSSSWFCYTPLRKSIIKDSSQIMTSGFVYACWYIYLLFPCEFWFCLGFTCQNSSLWDFSYGVIERKCWLEMFGSVRSKRQLKQAGRWCSVCFTGTQVERRCSWMALCTAGWKEGHSGCSRRCRFWCCFRVFEQACMYDHKFPLDGNPFRRNPYYRLNWRWRIQSPTMIGWKLHYLDK